MTKYDKIFIIIILLITTMLWLLPRLSNKNISNANILIYQENKLIGTYNINSNKIIEIKRKNIYMKLEIKNKKVSVLDSACPLKTCAHCGWISRENQSIICIPQKIIIKIQGKKNKIDAITY